MNVFLRTGLTATIVALVATGCGSDDQNFLESGKALLAKNDSAGAVIQFKNAVGKAPESAEARLYLARSLQRTGDLGAAEIEYRKAISLGIDRRPVVVELAQLLNDMGRADQALQELAALAPPIQPQVAVEGAAAPESDDPVRTAAMAAIRGDALLMKGEHGAAQVAYEAALAADASNATARLGQARLAFAGGDSAGAHRMLDALLKSNPGHAPSWLALASIALREGKVQDAVNAYDKAIELRPADLHAYVSIVPALLSLKQTDAATARVAQLAKVAPGAPATRYLQALVAYAKGDRTGARDSIQQALKSVPGDLRAQLLAGTIEHELGNHGSAEKYLSTVVAASPKDVQPRRLLATTYLRMGQPERARETLAPLLSEGATPDAGTLVLQADVATALKDPKAVGYLERAVKLQPDDPALRTRLGMARVTAGRPEEGIVDLQAAAAADTQHGTADLALVEYFVRAKQWPRAMAAAEALSRKLPNDPVSHNAVGVVRLAQGDKASARASFDKAMQVSPGFFPAAKYLAALDLADGKPDAAIERYRGVLAKNPAHKEAAILLAALMQRRHAPMTDIVAILDKSIAANGSALEPRLAKVDYLLSAGEAAAALDAARSAQGAATGDDARVLLALARAQQAAGENTQAAATFGKLVSLMPDSPLPYAGQAEAYAALKNWNAARIALDRAMALKPDHLPTVVAQVEVSIRAGELVRARREAQEIRKRWPKQGEGFIAEAQVLAAMKDLAGAEALLREGVARTGTTDVQNRLFGLLLSQDRVADAEKAASAWLASHASDYRAALFAADAYLSRQKFGDAERWYQRALQIRADDTVAMNNLAWVMGRLGKTEAVAMGKRALAKAPDSPVLLDTVGALQVQFGQLDEGIANLRKAAAAMPKSASVKVNLARGLIKAGKKDDARTLLDEAGRLQANDALKQEIDALRKTL